MCESQIPCPEPRRQGFFFETRHLFPFNSEKVPQTTDVQLGKEYQFYPLNLRVDLFAGLDFSQKKIGSHGGVRLSYFGRLPVNFLLGPIAEANVGYRDSQWNLGWKITGAAIYEPTSWLQFQANVGKNESGWISTLGINILFQPEHQVNPPPHAQRRPTAQILKDIDEDLKEPDLREYEVCHHTEKLPSTSSLLQYKMDAKGYDDALFGVQRSQIHMEKGSMPFSSKGGKAEILAIKELSVLGNADEEKDGFIPWIVKLAFQPEKKFGNIKVSVIPVDTPGACPDWSPPRPVVAYEPLPALCLLAELGNWREPMDRKSMGFPAKPGKAVAPVEAFRTLPGPYQSHPPDEVPKTSPSQCEWGAEQWQQMEYEPALDLVDLNTKGFREKGYLCVRLMEADNPGADQPLLQSSIQVSTLREKGSVSLGVNPDDERQVFVQWGLGNENLASRSPLVLGLEIKSQAGKSAP